MYIKRERSQYSCLVEVEAVILPATCKTLCRQLLAPQLYRVPRCSPSRSRHDSRRALETARRAADGCFYKPVGFEKRSICLHSFAHSHDQSMLLSHFVCPLGLISLDFMNSPGQAATLPQPSGWVSGIWQSWKNRGPACMLYGAYCE